MRQRQATQILFSFLVAVCILATAQAQTHAETAPAASIAATQQTTPPDKTPPDNTYHFNEATGLWENEVYTWNPATQQTTPKAKTNYSYNSDTQAWDTTEHSYNPTTGAYEDNTPPPTTQPAPASSSTTTKSTAPTSESTSTTTLSGTTQAVNGATGDASGPISQTGPESHNKTSTSQNDNHIFDSFYDASISNRVESQAHTGDASVNNNTIGGDATSGNAQAIANLINILQSSWGIKPEQLATFTSDINGDVLGDLYIDPRVFTQSQNNPANEQGNTDVTINHNSNGLIDNTINIGASSGNAAVTGNSEAGNASSGNAHAVANLVNLINSIIGAQKSFLGVVNIHGNLNGDILLPPEVLRQILASNSPAPVIPTVHGSIDANFTTNQAINNNVAATANTGTATVDNNTSAGNATSGNALTNVTLLNLTGRNIVAKDTLLVFVNVVGEWVGLLMNAPAGSTAAAIGGDVTHNTAQPFTGDVELNSTSNNRINNDITVASRSGNADVTENTKAGNARTGNATASVNLANIIGSNLSLSDWFGVLFINVFGRWNGSFGIDTIAGTRPTTPVGASNDSSTNQPAQVFSYASNGGNKTSQFRRIRLNGTYSAYVSPWQYDQEMPTDSHTSPSHADTSNQQYTLGITNDNQDTGSGSPFLRDRQLRQRDWTTPMIGAAIGITLLGGEQAAGAVSRRRKLRWQPATEE